MSGRGSSGANTLTRRFRFLKGGERFPESQTSIYFRQLHRSFALVDAPAPQNVAINSKWCAPDQVVGRVG
ncbi:hypothetical protein J6590_042515 [Homalodisca vitripennis]|nr:hypothetical protein J6590_042515 [Homalodisca vitripennis]